MSTFKVTIFAAPLFAALLLAGCGGDNAVTTGDSRQAGQGVAVGEPNGGAPVVSEFVKMAQDESCADTRNRLFLIDGKHVYWDRVGKCPDNSYAQRLFGATTQTVLCETTDSIAGPRTFCTNDAARKLFDTIQQHRELPDLGLAAAGHKVEQVQFLPKSGTAIEFRTLAKTGSFRMTDARNAVVKDEAAWEKLWNEHYANQVPPAPLPKVDFARDMVIAVFKAGNACDEMAVTRVVTKDDKLVVEYEVRGQPPGMVCAAVMMQKWQFIVVPRADAGVEFVEVKGSAMVSLMLDQTTRSQVSTYREAVVKDQQAWDALWADHAGQDARPKEVDFSKHMVVAVFLGSRPGGCHTATIESVSRGDKQITVRYVETVPGPATLCTKDITTPAHIVAIERSDLPVVFAKEVKPL